MHKTLPIFLTTLTLLFAVGCNGDSGSGPAGGGTTGIPEVDAVIDAVRAQDSDAFAALVNYTGIQCVREPYGTGDPPRCADAGVPEGTVVETLPVVVCHAEYQLKPDVPSFLLTRLEGFAFYGVLRPERHPLAYPSADRPWPTPEYAVVFQEMRQPGFSIALHLAEGMIVAVSSFGACGPSLPASDDPTWAVPPVPDAPATVFIPANPAAASDRPGGSSLRTITAVVHGEHYAIADISRGDVVLQLGVPGQPAPCGRDGEPITFIDNNGHTLFVTLVVRRDVTQTLVNLAPLPPTDPAP